MPNLPEFPTNPEYNVYKGARYVPLLMGPWDSTVQYEPLSIVTVEGNTYTSKWYVPAGVPVTDTDYWVLTGNFNGQVAAIQKQLEDLTTDVNQRFMDLSQEVTDNTADIAKNEGEIINVTRNVMAPYKGKNIVFVGDSWTVGGSATSQNKRYSTLLAKNLQMTEINLAVGGSGFTRDRKFIDQITAAKTSLTELQKMDTNIVLILGGINDLRHISDITTADFRTAVTACINAAIETFPNAVIALAICTTMVDNYTDTMRNFTYQGIIAAQQIHTAPVMIIQNIDAVLNGNVALYQEDKLHPTDLGYSLLAGYVQSALLGGSNSIYRYYSKFNLEAGVTEDTVAHAFRLNSLIHWTCGTLVLSAPITEQTLVAKIDPTIAPKTTLYYPIFSGNHQVGCMGITAAGNVYAIPSQSIQGFYFSDFSYMFS